MNERGAAPLVGKQNRDRRIVIFLNLLEKFFRELPDSQFAVGVDAFEKLFGEQFLPVCPVRTRRHFRRDFLRAFCAGVGDERNLAGKSLRSLPAGRSPDCLNPVVPFLGGKFISRSLAGRGKIVSGQFIRQRQRCLDGTIVCIEPDAALHHPELRIHGTEKREMKHTDFKCCDSGGNQNQNSGKDIDFFPGMRSCHNAPVRFRLEGSTAAAPAMMLRPINT